MTWVAFVLLATLATLPVLMTLRGGSSGRDRRQTAVALHRAQLVELDADLAGGRIAAREHGGAVLEVQRRLLAAAGQAEVAARPGRREPLLLSLVVVLAAALGLYAIDGRPELPASSAAFARVEPPPPRVAEPSALGLADDTQDQLQQMIASFDVETEAARQSDVLLGQTEEREGHLAQAAAAWRQALDIRFDAPLALRAADAESRAAQSVSPGTAALFRRAMATAPAATAAEWAPIVRQRLAEAALP